MFNQEIKQNIADIENKLNILHNDNESFRQRISIISTFSEINKRHGNRLIEIAEKLINIDNKVETKYDILYDLIISTIKDHKDLKEKFNVLLEHLGVDIVKDTNYKIVKK